MKKIIMLSTVAAGLLFMGCMDDKGKAASDTAASAVKSAKDATAKAADATVEAAKEAGNAVEKTADKAVDDAKAAVHKATAPDKE